MKIAMRDVILAVIFSAGLGGCANLWQDGHEDTVLGVVVSQRILVEGVPGGGGVSVGVGAAGGSGGGTIFGLGVNVDLGQLFRGSARNVGRQYTVRLQDGRVLEVRDTGSEALADGSCVALVLDRNGVPRSVKPSSACAP